MRHAISILTAAMTVAFYGPAVAQDFSPVKVRDIPLDLGDEIAGVIVAIAMDDNGRYYLADWQQHAIWATDQAGGIIRRIGREGSGPGDLLEPLDIALFEDRIIVHDSGNGRISIFSADGGHVTGFRVEERTRGGIAVNDDGLVAIKTAGDASRFTVYDLGGNEVGRRGKGDPASLLIGLSQHISLAPDGHILAANPNRYDVRLMAWDGSILATYEADPPGYAEFDLDLPESGMVSIDFGATSWTPLFRPLVVGDRVLVQRAARRIAEDDGTASGDLFTMDGVPLQLGIELPMEFFHAEGGLLYAINTTPVDEGELNPSIVVYRLADGTSE